MSAHQKETRTRIPRTIRALAVPIILVWVAYTAAVNLLVPQVEKVGMANAVSMSPQDAPAVIAAKRMGQEFGESSSDSIAMVLVGEQPLGSRRTAITPPWWTSSRPTRSTSSTSTTSGAT